MSENARKPGFDAARIESERQAAWETRGDYDAPAPPPAGEHGVYVKSSSPFTSGNLHMGHVRDYAIGDAYARFRRARGDSVLMGFGFDAFGLPAELAAIERGEPPADWVAQCGERMLGQMKRLGFSFDYDRVFYSSDEGPVPLVPVAVPDPARNGADLPRRRHRRLVRHLPDDPRLDPGRGRPLLALPQRGAADPAPDLVPEDHAVSRGERRQHRQAGELGRAGAGDPALHPRPGRRGRDRPRRGGGPGADEGRALTAFTPHRDAAGAAEFVLLSPRHPAVDGWTRGDGVREELERMRSGGWERSARDARSVPILDTGLSIASGEIAAAGGPAELPVFISPLVDARFGPTAALGIPAVDEADADLAARMERLAPTDPARLFPHGAQASEGGEGGEGAPVDAPVAGAREAKRYRANDFSISRQRSWGTPIPVIHCPEHGPVPVGEADLPVVLPRDIRPTGEGNPLAERPDFVDAPCPVCGAPAKRETDTLDCHFDALFLWVPAAVPPADRAERMFTHPDLPKWLPAERLVAGGDSGGFVFDQRIVTKALRDHGEFAFMEEGEPFAGCLFHEMVIADGRKMSKHLGNVVNPDELVAKYGADTVRVAVLWAAGPAKTLNWSDGAIRFASKFLRGFWTYAHDRFVALEGAQHDPEAAAETEFMRERLRKWCENGVGRITEDTADLQMHKAIRDLTRLFERIQDFEKQLKKRGQLDRADAEALVAALLLLARALEPFAPHTAEQILLDSGRVDPSELPSPWPDAAGIPVVPAGSTT